MSEICLNCNENIAIDPWYCLNCGIDIYYSEEAPELTLSWKE